MFLIITMYILVLAMIITIIRMITGPTVWDTLLTLNLFSVKTMLLLTVYGVYKEQPILLDISISHGIIGFLTVILLSRFILKGGRQK